MNTIQQETKEKNLGMKKLPDMLNVLTILTFIGSGLGLLGLVSNFLQDCDKLINQMDDMAEMDGMLGKFMDMSRESLVTFCDNRTLILTTTIVGLVLCVMGAILMRQLKKQGFIIYTIGELLAPVIMIILSLSSSVGMALTGLIIPVIFIALYATNRKHLVN